MRSVFAPRRGRAGEAGRQGGREGKVKGDGGSDWPYRNTFLGICFEN